MKKLVFTQLAQEESNWCWVATGLSIAQYFGRGTELRQADFYLKAGGPLGNVPEPEPGTWNLTAGLQQVQVGWQELGLAPGTLAVGTVKEESNGATAVAGILDFDVIKEEIEAGRPILTRVGRAAGDHALVIYGYDAETDGGTVHFSDPWARSSFATDSPPRDTYQSMPYSAYVENMEFRWLQSAYRIGQEPG
ncbi:MULTISPECIES: papain-like cysteine protease family protein [unclassified Streptomyces]|uniref:C39 family peptidase n=1 Tax=Streptomyces sp. NBC_00060 TaxID=2975636 RepID=A0AAU2GT95_9ACTN